MTRTGQYKPLIIPALTSYLPFFLFLSRAALALFHMGDIHNPGRPSTARLATTCGWYPFHSKMIVPIYIHL